MTSLWIFVISPVCWSNLALHKDQLCGTEGRTMAKCPCDEGLAAKGWGHLKPAHFWQRHDQGQHAGLWKFSNIACGHIKICQDACTRQ